MFCFNHQHGKRFFPFYTALVFVAALLLPAASGAAGTAPMDVVRESNESGLEIYRTTDTVDAAVEERIFAVIDGVTDYETLAAAATERSCRDLTDEQSRQLNARLLRLVKDRQYRITLDLFNLQDPLGAERGHADHNCLDSIQGLHL